MESGPLNEVRERRGRKTLERPGENNVADHAVHPLQAGWPHKLSGS